MHRMRMAEMDLLRVTSEESDIHSSCHRKLPSSPANLRSVSSSADIPSKGINGFRALTEECVNDDGLAQVYTSKPMVNRNRLIDSEGVPDIGCINDSVNVVVSRSNSNTSFMGNKTSHLMRENRSTEGYDRERGLGADHPCHQSGDLGSLHGRTVSRVGQSPFTSSAEFFQCNPRPAGDKSGPSKAVKGRPRISVITMGKFKIGVKKRSKKPRKNSVSRSTECGEWWFFGDGISTGKLSVWAKYIVSVNSVSLESASWLSAGLRKVLGSRNDTLFWLDVWSQRDQLATLFPQLFRLTIDQGCLVRDQGIWHDNRWTWCPNWRRPLYERDTHRLQDFLEALNEETLQEIGSDTWILVCFLCLLNAGYTGAVASGGSTTSATLAHVIAYADFFVFVASVEAVATAEAEPSVVFAVPADVIASVEVAGVVVPFSSCSVVVSFSIFPLRGLVFGYALLLQVCLM
ncbi:hypothetical protein Ancab_002367 [Ancistrocladus abbreviatus]